MYRIKLVMVELGNRMGCKWACTDEDQDVHEIRTSGPKLEHPVPSRRRAKSPSSPGHDLHMPCPCPMPWSLCLSFPLIPLHSPTHSLVLVPAIHNNTPELTSTHKLQRLSVCLPLLRFVRYRVWTVSTVQGRTATPSYWAFYCLRPGVSPHHSLSNRFDSVRLPVSPSVSLVWNR